jgi:tetratricopeptide (TPR) repeat protein
MKRTIPRALLCASILTVILSGCDSPEDKVAGYLASATELLASKNYEKAQVQAKNALKIDNRSAKAYMVLAEIYSQQAKYQPMYAALTQAVQIDEKNADAFRQLAKLLLLSGDLDKARENLDKALALEPKHPLALLVQGMLLSRKGKSDEGFETIATAYRESPAELELAVAYAGMLVQRKDFDRALALLAEADPRFPDADVLRLIRFQIHAGRDQTDQAAAVLQDLIKARPGKLDYIKMLAVYRLRTGDSKAAEDALRAGVAANPAAVEAKLMLAGFLAQRDKASAIAALQGFVKEAPDAAPLKFALADTYVKQGDVGEASQVYKDIAEGAFPSEDVLGAKNELIRLALQENNTGEARRIVDEVLTTDAQNAPALQARALIALSERRTDDAIADLRIVVRDQPDSDSARLLLARAYLQNNAMELAEQSLDDALKINPLNADAALLYARNRMRKQDFKGALDTLDRLLAGGIQNQTAESLRIQIRLMQKDWSAATDLATGVARSTGNPSYERYILGLTLFGQQRYAESIDLFREVLANNPSMEGAMSAIPRAYRAAGKPQEGIAFLREQVAAKPDNLSARAMLADELLASGESTAAIATYREALKIKPESAAVYRRLAILLVREKQVDEAVKLLRDGIAATNAQTDLKLQLATLLDNTGARDEATTLYRELLDKDPTLDVAANNLAVILAGDGSDPSKLDEAARIAARFSTADQPWFADTLGWIYYLQKNYPKAAELLTRANRGAPDEPVFGYHLGAALYELKDYAGARKALEAAEKQAQSGKTYPEQAQAAALLAKLPQG